MSKEVAKKYMEKQMGRHVLKGKGGPKYAVPEKKNRRAFTLLEMIVVVAIIGILLAVMVPAVNGYLVSAEMIKLNQSAKTIFLAAQDYLSHAQSSGELADINKGSHLVNRGDIYPPISDAANPDEDGDGGGGFTDANNFANDRIRYLRLSRDDTHENPDLERILNAYFAGDDIMKNSILVEYNAETGVVRAVFYSERADYLDYTEGGRLAPGNVESRVSEDLREKRQGYYGLDYTGRRDEVDELDPVEVELVNEDRLYVRWGDVTPYSLKDDITYTISIRSAVKEKKGQEYLRIEGIPNINNIGGQLAHGQEDVDERFLTREPAITVGTGPSNGEQLIYKTVDGTINYVLDDLHRSIYENYPTVPRENIYAIVTAESSSGSIASSEAVSNIDHSYYEDEMKMDGKPAFGVANPRHLNNIRYSEPDAHFAQYTDIDWGTLEGNPSRENYDTVSFLYRTYNADGSFMENYGGATYRGVYQCVEKKNEKEKKWITYHLDESGRAEIQNLVLKSSNAAVPSVGWFNTIEGKSESERAAIRNITLRAVTLDTTAPGNIGSFAGMARFDSELIGCRVENFHEEDGSIKKPSIIRTTRERIGGLVGVAQGGNDGTHTCLIQDSYNAGEVTADGGSYKGSQVGGIAAVSNTAHFINTWNYGVITGRNNVGGITGESSGENTITRSGNEGEIAGSGDYVGGLIGVNSALGVPVTDSVNKGNVTGMNHVGGLIGNNNTNLKNLTNEGNVRGNTYVGGIVGKNGNTLTNCTNAGLVYANDTAGREADFRYIGGIAGENGDAGKILQCSSIMPEDKLDKEKELEHALDGYAKGDFSALLGDLSGAARQMRGIYVGGIAGYNSGLIENYQVSSKIVGESYVGGVAGYNRGTVQYTGSDRVDGIVAASGDYAGGFFGENESFNGAKGFHSKAHVTADRYAGGVIGKNGKQGASVSGYVIEDCSADGAAYAYTAYAGGITGENFGTISDSRSEWSGYQDLEDLALNNPGSPRLALWGHGDYIGGIAGRNAGKIDRCRGGNFVLGNNYIGGVAGHNDGGSITACETTGGSVLARGNYAGGFIGKNSSDQDSTPLSVGQLVSRAKTVKGKYFVGGIIGCNLSTGGTSEDLTIIANNGSSTVTPTVMGEAYVGGIIGYNGIAEMDISAGADPTYQSFEDTPFPAPAPGKTTNMLTCQNYGTVTGTRYVGGIIGLNSSESMLKIEKCHNLGAVTAQEQDKTNPRVSDGFYFVGGVTGRNTQGATISSSSNSGEIVSPSTYTGGLVEVNEGFITDCFNGGTVKSSHGYVGGIAGLNNRPSSGAGGEIQNCRFNGGAETVVRGDGDFVGGIAGENRAAIQDCSMNSGRVEGRDAVGGITGFNGRNGTVSGSNTSGGSVRGRNFTGGIIGYNLSQNATPGTGAGGISGLSNKAEVIGEYYVGGIAGYNDGNTITDCKNESGAYVVGTSGKNSAGNETQGSKAMLTLEYTDAGGTRQTASHNRIQGEGAGGIIGCNQNGSVISQCENLGTVVGASDTTSGTGGISGSNYGRIEFSSNMGTVIGSSNAWKAMTNKAELVNDGFNVGGIAGLNVDGASLADGRAALGDKGHPIVAGGGNVGGIAGSNNGEMTNPVSEDEKCTVQGYANTGGLVGFWASGATIEYLRTGGVNVEDLKIVYGTVEGSSANKPVGASEASIGGVFGYSDGNTVDGYRSHVTVKMTDLTVNQCVGGIIGSNAAMVKNCVVLGNVTGKNDRNSTGGTGGIAGRNTKTGFIENCELDGIIVQGYSNVGGVIGYNQGSMLDCLTERGKAVRADNDYAGGYIGQDRNHVQTDIFTDKNLVNQINVVGNFNTGGIVGYSINNIRGCVNLATVEKVGGNNVGGIVGQSSSYGHIVEDCVNKGVVKNSVGNYGGGIVGVSSGNRSDMNLTTQIINCENQGEVVSVKGEHIGGIVGLLEKGAITSKCYNRDTGNVHSGSSSGTDRLGGIAGEVSAGAVVQDSVNYGTVSNRSRGVGGIVGRLGGGSADSTRPTVLRCVNESEDLKHPSNHELGGIVAQSNGGVIDSCTNKASLTGKFNDIGGILGWSFMGTTEIINSVNTGSISNTGQGTGGIIGHVGGGAVKLLLQNCRNEGSISSTGNRVAGIAGYTDKLLEADNCVNNGAVSGGSSSGGILGYTAPNITASMTRCRNNGEISGKTMNGGILGTAEKDGSVQITECVNTADVSVTETAAGGIAGSVESDKAKLIKCETAANSSGKTPVISGPQEAGGIVGRLNAVYARAVNCVSSAKTMGVGANSRYIGGIAGRNLGEINSCRALLPGSVEGQNYVGGIAGANVGAGAIIVSTLPADVQIQARSINEITPTCNEQSVTALNGFAGGIAGWNSGGAIVGVYNTGKVTTTSSKSGDMAGGLVGRLDKGDVENGGKLVNSFNIGVTIKPDATGEVGGIAGERIEPYSQKDHRIEGCYFWDTSERIARALPAGSTAARLAVGNEPVRAPDGENQADYTLSNQVFLDNEIPTTFTDEELQKTGQSDADRADLENRVQSAVDQLLRKLNYRLPQPENVTSKSDQEYQYTFQWEMVQGLVDGYQIFLRKDDGTEIALPGGAVSDKMTTSASIDFKALVEDGTLEVGKTYSIVVQTKGVTSGEGVALSMDSEKEISCTRKILPVLPAPPFEGPFITDNPIVSENGVHTILIDGQTYAAESYYSGNTFNNYLGGFVYMDKASATGTAKKVEAPRKDVEKNYGIDITYAANQKNVTRYVDVQAISSNTGDDGYANSAFNRIVYRILVRLDTPENLQSTFTGSISEDSYRLSWDPVDNNSGYRIQLYTEDGTTLGDPFTASARIENGRVVCDYVPGADLAKKKLHYTVTAIGNLSQYYLDSEESAPCDMTAPIVLQPPKNIHSVRDPDDDTKFTVSWDAAEGAQGYTMKVFRKKAGSDDSTRTAYTPQGQTSNVLELSALSQPFPFLEEDFDYTYIIEMVSKGEPGVSLTSEETSYSFTVPKRLTPPNKPLAPVLIGNAGDATFKFMWDHNAEHTAENCQGYVLVLKDPGTNAVVASIQIDDTSTAAQHTAQISFTENGSYKEGFRPGAYSVYLMARGKDPISSDSNLCGEPVTLVLPDTVESPANARAVLGYTDGDFNADKSAVPEARYGAVQHTVSWDAYAAGSSQQNYGTGFQVKAYVTKDGVRTEVTAAEMAAMNLTGSLNDKSCTGFTFTAPVSLAGQTVELDVTALANSAWAINSLPSTVSVTLPKLEIAPPDNISAVIKSSGTILEVKWQAPAGTPGELGAKLKGFEAELLFFNADGSSHTPVPPVPLVQIPLLAADGSVAVQTEIAAPALPTGITYKVRMRAVPLDEKIDQWQGAWSGPIAPGVSPTMTLLSAGAILLLLKFLAGLKIRP